MELIVTMRQGIGLEEQTRQRKSFTINVCTDCGRTFCAAVRLFSNRRTHHGGVDLPNSTINPHRNTSFDAKTVAILPKMCSPELRKKSKKNKKTFEHDISPHCRGAPAGPIAVIFCMLGGTHDIITRTKF